MSDKIKEKAVELSDDEAANATGGVTDPPDPADIAKKLATLYFDCPKCHRRTAYPANQYRDHCNYCNFPESLVTTTEPNTDIPNEGQLHQSTDKWTGLF